MRTVFLDLETTGLDPRTDEIVEIGILGEDGQILLDTLDSARAAPQLARCSAGPWHRTGGRPGCAHA